MNTINNTMNYESYYDKEHIQYLEFTKLADCVKQLEQIPESLRTREYSAAIKYVRTILQEKCIHEYIEDYIDIDPDNGKYITYCIYCEKTLNKSGHK